MQNKQYKHSIVNLQNKEKIEKNHDVILKQSLNEIISNQYGGMLQQ